MSPEDERSGPATTQGPLAYNLDNAQSSASPPRVECAVDPDLVAAFTEAGAQRAAAVQCVAAAVRTTAHAVRSTGGTEDDVAQAMAGTRRTLVHALAGAIAAEIGGTP